MSYKTFAEAFAASAPVAANDNEPNRKKPEPRYRGTLPALKWLFTHHPELAPAMADAVQSLTRTNWRADAVDNDHDVRPSEGELLRAASTPDQDGVVGLIREPRALGATYRDDEWISLGKLRFNRGRLMEWGTTKKGKKLKPSDRVVSRQKDRPSPRNPRSYLRLVPTTPSPMQADPLPRTWSNEPALPPLYDPLNGVEEARALLTAHGVDGAVGFDNLRTAATKCPTAIARGSHFFGGVSRSSGTASSGAPLMWDGPEEQKGEARRVIEEVAARGTLQSIGEFLGCDGAEALRRGKAALVETAIILMAANDNRRPELLAA